MRGFLATARVVLASCIFLSVLAACSSHAPELRSLSYRLYVRPEGDVRTEHLSIFANAIDEDGLADIETMYVIHDDSELFWKLTVDTWTRKDESGDAWFGSPDLVSYEASGPVKASAGTVGTGRSFPRGGYRALIVDKAGERVERNFRLDMARTDDSRLPSVAIQGADARIASPCPVNTLFFYGRSGDVLKTVAVSAGTFALEALYGSPEYAQSADTIAVYGFDPRKETGFFSWKTKLNP